MLNKCLINEWMYGWVNERLAPFILVYAHYLFHYFLSISYHKNQLQCFLDIQNYGVHQSVGMQPRKLYFNNTHVI